MSQPSLRILSLAKKFHDELRMDRKAAMHHILRHARKLGYPRRQAKDIVLNVYDPNHETWRTWG
jgi:hypothetical protein